MHVIEVEGPPVVPAGFPSPAEDYYAGPVSLDRNLLRNPATFVLRVSGDSMVEAGISDGDEIIVDRSLTPDDGDVVVAVLYDEFTVKRLRLRPPQLEPANPAFPVIPLPRDGEGFEVWGVVTAVIRHLKPGGRHGR
ncbi:translesion error-prone DNA polymerase V autoproteolytic subunit [Amycolatopsis sp. NPDC004079]|uniref:LexA family protein n=1 Tax=Amycolatopsis sp. NPDC004079 TaxID=3154549 RepID=UPI0033ADCCE7